MMHPDNNTWRTNSTASAVMILRMSAWTQPRQTRFQPGRLFSRLNRHVRSTNYFGQSLFATEFARMRVV